MNFNFVYIDELVEISNSESLLVSYDAKGLEYLFGLSNIHGIFIHLNKIFPISFMIDTIVHESIHEVIAMVDGEESSHFDETIVDDACRLFGFTREGKIQAIIKIKEGKLKIEEKYYKDYS